MDYKSPILTSLYDTGAYSLVNNFEIEFLVNLYNACLYEEDEKTY